MPATRTSKSSLAAPNIRSIPPRTPCSSWQSPTAFTFVVLVTARVSTVIGLVRFSIQASGQARSIVRAISSRTGTFRSARDSPPGPTVSPTDW